MAARKDARNRDSSNKLAGATQLLNRLEKHANGELALTQTQINAARIYIGKYIPDLKAVEHSGTIEHSHTLASVLATLGQ